MSIKAITLNTFKEAARNKIFYLLIFFGILFAFSSKLLSMLTIGDGIRVMKDVGMGAIDFFSVLIVIFTGINLVYKEIDKKTVYTILSKPITRDEFILGKFLGLALTTLVAVAAMAAIFFIFLLIFSGEFDSRIFLYLFMLMMQLLILIAVSLLFSSFSTPILSSIFTISIYLVGQVLWTYNEFKNLLGSPFSRRLTTAIYYLLPNLHKFNIKTDVVLGAPIPTFSILTAVGYAMLYIGVTLTLAIIIFRKREFQ